MKQHESQQVIGQAGGPSGGQGGLSGLTLALSVLLCIGAMSDGASAAVVAQSLSRHATTASERESVAALLSNLNEAARKLCRVPAHQAVHLGRDADVWQGEDKPTALRPYDNIPRCDARPPIGEHLLNLPPPATSF